MSSEANFTIYFDSSINRDHVVWQSPALSQLDWSNCTAITEYWAEVINLLNEPNPSDLDVYGNVGKLTGFIDSVVPEDWPSPPSVLFATSWYAYMWSNNLWENNTEREEAWATLDSVLQNECRWEICANLDVQGDPDVSGPGVSQPSHTVRVPLQKKKLMMVLLFR